MKRCPLTRQQLRTVRMFADGLTYTQIARAMGITRATVNAHMSAACKRLDQPGAAQVVLICVREGWIFMPEFTAPTSDVLLTRIAAWLDGADQQLREILATVKRRQRLTSQQREYLTAFDAHLRARSWDRVGLDETRARMSERLEELLAAA